MKTVFTPSCLFAMLAELCVTQWGVILPLIKEQIQCATSWMDQQETVSDAPSLHSLSLLKLETDIVLRFVTRGAEVNIRERV